MSDAILERLRDVIQVDVGNRGLRTDPTENLVTACAGDFAAACRGLAAAACPPVVVVTGFPIPHAQPPCHETDGPLGAVYLARALRPLGLPVILIIDEGRTRPLEEGLREAGLADQTGVRVLGLPRGTPTSEQYGEFWRQLRDEAGGPLPHLIALERVGPSHSPFSVGRQRGASPAAVEEFRREVPEASWNRCHTMRGRDITDLVSPAHEVFEDAAWPPMPTIGIGDGGNEIGMGKVRWEVIRRNIPKGGVVACRVPTDYLIVAGVSNWGAYALAAGVRLLRGAPFDPALFDPEVERRILQAMVERGPLVDGVTGRQTVSVDGLPFERYIEPLVQIGEIVKGERR